MQIKQESLRDFNGSAKSRYEMREYAFNLLSRDLSHIQHQADMRNANSAELTRLLDEVADILRCYR